ncbi:SAM-dependent methyltransferase [Actinoallomurus rhizosphaericola]|uniref:SAM-dependent methyltransferase n=1 Tax=Actinoallomurus rhizosphaericola TaxID=2952536 RepID=UPI00209124AF|nr:SAM-dependent methyltransferase [Actinoallomurus rhizosphaericola]MCO5994430.1 SAM-dependent methyltransferase [Actinoallomurus rhizosphaericola]
MGANGIGDGVADAGQPLDLRTDVAHSARIYDYMLGGKDNFAADRAAADAIAKHLPTLPISMRANRDFMLRMTRYLVGDLGIRQFLDIGTGLPTSPNLHEVAQELAPETRVVYVDNDPIVLAHARALLTSSAEGRTAYIDADLRDTGAILGSTVLRETLDLGRPVALTLIAILQFFVDEDEALAVVRSLVEPLAPGSVLALSVVPAADEESPLADGVNAYRSQGIPMKMRTRAETERFFAGLELVDPGVVKVTEWHPDEPADPDDPVPHMYGGVAVKR